MWKARRGIWFPYPSSPSIGGGGYGNIGANGVWGYGTSGGHGVWGYGGPGGRGLSPHGVWGLGTWGRLAWGLWSALPLTELMLGMMNAEDLVQRYEQGLEVVKKW
jgi:hypothetical protein